MGRPPPAAIKLSRSSASSGVSRHVAAARQYPMGCGPTTFPQPQHSLPQSAPLHHGAILRLMFSGVVRLDLNGHQEDCFKLSYRPLTAVYLQTCPGAVRLCKLYMYRLIAHQLRVMDHSMYAFHVCLPSVQELEQQCPVDNLSKKWQIPNIHPPCMRVDCNSLSCDSIIRQYRPFVVAVCNQLNITCSNTVQSMPHPACTVSSVSLLLHCSGQQQAAHVLC